MGGEGHDKTPQARLRSQQVPNAGGGYDQGRIGRGENGHDKTPQPRLRSQQVTEGGGYHKGRQRSEEVTLSQAG